MFFPKGISEFWLPFYFEEYCFDPSWGLKFILCDILDGGEYILFMVRFSGFGWFIKITDFLMLVSEFILKSLLDIIIEWAI